MKLIITIIFIFIQFYSFSQMSSYANYERYWSYRNRLKYFVKEGTLEGQSCISSYRNPGSNVNVKLHFGDHGVFLGWYIGVLATEYKLLNDNYQNTNKTLYELCCALEAYRRLDLCEDKEPWNKPSSVFDGFFMKDDVRSDFLLSDPDPITNEERNQNLISLNQNLIPGQTYPYGHPAYVNVIESGGSDSPRQKMSQDQAIHLLLGMALTKVCLPNQNITIYDPNGIGISYNFNATARIFSERIFNTLYHNGNWRIHDPDGNQLSDNEGGSTRLMGRGYIKAIEFITGNSLSSLDHPVCCWQSYQHGTAFPDYIWNEWDAHLICTLGAIGDSWRFLTVNNTYNGILTNSTFYNWEPFYITLWKFLHSKSRDISVELGKAKDQLDLAPCEGPYRYYNTNNGTGWGSTSKYRMTKKEQNGEKGSTGNFNGVDYMLMYNLYRLVENPIGYASLIDRKFNNFYYPYEEDVGYFTHVIGDDNHEAHLKAFETIESNSYVDTYVHEEYYSPVLVFPLQQNNGNVTMRAGEKITLKPGFKAEKGSYFHAYIDPLNCDMTKSEGNGLYAETPMFTTTDSIFCANNYSNLPRIENDVTWDDIEEQATQIEEPNNNELSSYVYPNPNKGEFKAVITNYNNENISVIITNMLGKVIYNKSNIYNNEISLNISDQPSGIYYIQIAVGNKVFKEKIILQ